MSFWRELRMLKDWLKRTKFKDYSYLSIFLLYIPLLFLGFGTDSDTYTALNAWNYFLKNNDYVMIYANAWQLFSSSESPFKLPFYKKINNGRKFEDRLEQLFQFIDENEIAVAIMKDYLF